MKAGKKTILEIIPVVIILVLCFIAYRTALTKVGFVSDDYFWWPFYTYTPSELMNLAIAQHQGEADLTYFRPVVVASHQLDYILYDHNAFGCHLTNVLIHSANAVMLYILCRIIGLNILISLISSVFFAVYPGHSEVVTWISGRSDLLALFFLLISLILWCKARVYGHVAWFPLSVIAFIFAILSKEVAAGGILIFPVMDLCLFTCGKYGVFKEKKIYQWKKYGVLLLCLLGIILLRFWLFTDIGGHKDISGSSNYFKIDFTRVWQSVSSFAEMLFTPVSEIVWADSGNYWRFSFIASEIIIGFILIYLLYALLFSGNAKANKGSLTVYILLGLVWTIAMFVPVLPLPPVTRTLIRSRFLYSPSVGLSVIIGLGIGVLFYKSKKRIINIAGAIGLIIILLSSVYLLNRQNLIWAESSGISEKANSVIVDHSKRLRDNGTVVFVNTPVKEGYKGIECMPVMTPEYFYSLYNIKNVKVVFTVKDSNEIFSWWAKLKENNHNVVGFVCYGDIQSLQPLP